VFSSCALTYSKMYKSLEVKVYRLSWYLVHIIRQVTKGLHQAARECTELRHSEHYWGRTDITIIAFILQVYTTHPYNGENHLPYLSHNIMRVRKFVPTSVNACEIQSGWLWASKCLTVIFRNAYVYFWKGADYTQTILVTLHSGIYRNNEEANKKVSKVKFPVQTLTWNLNLGHSRRRPIFDVLSIFVP
jgi:hypothetical protein